MDREQCLSSRYVLFPFKDLVGRSQHKIARTRPYCPYGGCVRTSFGSKLERNQHDRDVHSRFLYRVEGCTKGSFDRAVRRNVHEKANTHILYVEYRVTLSKIRDLVLYYKRK